jgi:hypothetical protein
VPEVGQCGIVGDHAGSDQLLAAQRQGQPRFTQEQAVNGPVSMLRSLVEVFVKMPPK